MSSHPDPEIERQHERVRVLAAGLGVPVDFEVPDTVRRHAQEGRTAEAVRELRRRTPGRLSLVRAKRMVDVLGGRDGSS
ncbi:MAG: hypothetical protein JJT89_17080 [Nitriliruptoraceae bacterium]|nr:hypothetical protein [Nitriliruptoraceae bacterium]